MGEVPMEFEEIISDDFEIGESFNKFSVNIVPTLKIYLEETFEINVDEFNDRLLKAVNKFKSKYKND